MKGGKYSRFHESEIVKTNSERRQIEEEEEETRAEKRGKEINEELDQLTGSL